MFTPTEQRIIDLLSDGLPHARSELMGLLNDDMTTVKTLGMHIYRIRNKLAGHGQNIITEVVGGRRQIHFRYVRLIGSAYSGYR